MATPFSRKNYTCKKCGDIFTKPKFLPCFHTFCLYCIERLIFESKKSNVFQCPDPDCKKLIAVPERGASGFTDNFYIADGLQEIQLLRDRNLGECVLHKGHRLINFCKVCNIPICQKCSAEQHATHGTVLFTDEVMAAKKEIEGIDKDLEKQLGILKKGLAKLPNLESTQKKVQEMKEELKREMEARIAQLTKMLESALRTFDEEAASRKSKHTEAILCCQKEHEKVKALKEQAKRAAVDELGITVFMARDSLRRDLPDGENTKKLMAELSQTSGPPPLPPFSEELIRETDSLISALTDRTSKKTGRELKADESYCKPRRYNSVSDLSCEGLSGVAVRNPLFNLIDQF